MAQKSLDFIESSSQGNVDLDRRVVYSYHDLIYLRNTLRAIVNYLNIEEENAN